jgi:hypothetical protein
MNVALGDDASEWRGDAQVPFQSRESHSTPDASLQRSAARQRPGSDWRPRLSPATSTSLPATTPGVADAAFNRSNVLLSASALAVPPRVALQRPAASTGLQPAAPRALGFERRQDVSCAHSRAAIDNNRLHEPGHSRKDVDRLIRAQLTGQREAARRGLFGHAHRCDRRWPSGRAGACAGPGCGRLHPG